jgi:glycosyltransferase involved in cell wall biosynthesis
MKLSIVIPVYNEKKTILEIIEIVKSVILPEKIKEREIVLVDDCSKDGTRDILKNINDSEVKVFYHKVNKGKGGALNTGFKQTTGDIVIIQDADLEYDPHEYPKLLKPILDDKADVVFGSRFVGGDSHRILYFWHTTMNKFLTLLSNVFSDLNLTDMETCYKVFRKDILDQIDIEENRFGFEPEITAKVGELSRTKNVRIYEVGISYYGRTYDEGKHIGWKDGVRALWCIFKYNTSTFAHFSKYIINGVFVAIAQIIAIFVLVNYFDFSTPKLQEIANLISIEISVLVGLFLHSFITWRYKYETTRNFLKVFVYFHLVTGISFLVRAFLFPILASMNVDYMSNTLIGIAVAIVINFFGYDKLVFKRKLEDIIYKRK